MHFHNRYLFVRLSETPSFPPAGFFLRGRIFRRFSLDIFTDFL